MGRLGGARLGAGRRRPQPREALEMARRVGDKAALADVLATTRLVNRGPDNLDERLADGARARPRRRRDRQRRSCARSRTSGCSATSSSWATSTAPSASSRRCERLAEARGDRYSRWLVRAARRAPGVPRGPARAGRGAGRRRRSSPGGGRAAGPDEAPAQALRLQMLFVRREQGRLDELVELDRGLRSRSPRDQRLALHARARLRRARARRRRRAASSRRSRRRLRRAVPRDALWLLSMSALGDVVSFLGDAVRAELLYRLVSPTPTAASSPSHRRAGLRVAARSACSPRRWRL